MPGKVLPVTKCNPVMSNMLSRSRFAYGTAATLAGAGLASAPARAAQFAMKIGHNLPIDHPIHVRLVQMWKAVRDETSGKLDVAIFPNSQLGGDSAMISQLRLGALQFMMIGTGPLTSSVPLCAIESTPFAWRSETEALQAMDGQLGAYIAKAVEAKLGLITFPKKWPLGFHEITSSTHPMRNADDLKDFKIRVSPSVMLVDTFKTLGASPIVTSLAELYTALQTHLVDGQETPYSTVELSRYYEVQKYLSVSNHVWAAYWLGVNPDAWKSLPADVQAVVQRNAEKYAILQRRDSKILDASLVDKLKRQGLIFVACDRKSLQARLAGGFYARWKKEFGETAWSLMEQVAGKVS